MTIESLLEHQNWESAAVTATITAAAGNAVITGTTLTNLSVDDIVQYLDDAGKLQYGQLKSITDDANAEFYTAAQAAATAAVPRVMDSAAQNHYWFEANNNLLRNQIIAPAGTESEVAILATPGAAPLSKISMNEGIFIKSAYVRFPYQYTMSDTQIFGSFYYVDQDGDLIGRVRTVGEDSDVFYIRENGPVELNAYVPPPIIAYPSHPGISADTTYQISATIGLAVDNLGEVTNADQQLPRVSAVNAPDDLNGQFLPVYIGIQIIHAATFLTA